MMSNDTEVEEKLAPRLIALRWRNEYDGNIVSEVINTPQEYPVILLICNVEILSIKDKRIGEPATEIEGKLVIVG